MRVAINGFGRIGRLFFRVAFRKVEIVAINDLTNKETLAYLLSKDSIHGKWKNVGVSDKGIVVDGKEIVVVSEPEPQKLPWKDMDVDIVIESTGRFRSRDKAEKHIIAGAKCVIISAPAKGDVPHIVLGVNHHIIDEMDIHGSIISMASCTTNCLAPMVKVLDESFGFVKGFMSTVHAYTNDQRILDLQHKDLRRTRAAAINIIPTTTGAAKATALVYPKVKGKLNGIALRVPVADGSITDLTAILEKDVSIEDVNTVFKRYADRELKNILEYSEEPLVSTDIIGNPASCIIDGSMTDVNGNMVKVLGWYDNEFGYANRLADLTQLIVRKGL